MKSFFCFGILFNKIGYFEPISNNSSVPCTSIRNSDVLLHELPVPDQLNQTPPAFHSFNSKLNTIQETAASSTLPSCDELFKTKILDIPDTDLKTLNFTYTDASGQSWDEINTFLRETANVTENGCYFPTGICKPSQTVLVVVPYRDRQTQLKTFVYNMHQFLQRQFRAYCIVVTGRVRKIEKIF